ELMGTPTQVCMWSYPNVSAPAGRPFRCISDMWLLISGDAKVCQSKVYVWYWKRKDVTQGNWVEIGCKVIRTLTSVEIEIVLRPVHRESDRDVRELYTRSRAVRDEIFSQRYRFSNLEHEQERTVVTFGALWRPMLALEAWAGNCFAVRATRDERSCYCVEAGEGPYGAVDDTRLVSLRAQFFSCVSALRLVARDRAYTHFLIRIDVRCWTDTESEPFEGEAETPESPYIVAPPTCHVEESEGSGTSGMRSTSSDSTARLLHDHPLTHTKPNLVPILHRTAHMAVRVSPVMSPGLSAGIAEVAAMSDSAFRKGFRSSYDSLPSPTLPVQKRYRGTSELILDTDSEEDENAEDEDPVTGDEGLAARDEGLGMRAESRGLDDEGHKVESDGLGLGEEEEAVPEGQQQAAPVVGTTVSTLLGLGYRVLRHRELASGEDHVYNTFVVCQGSDSAPESERLEKVSTSRQPTLTTWTDPEDGMVYIDVPAYPPPVPPTRTPPSPEWSSGSFFISSAPYIVPSPISSPMISLTVPSPIAAYVATTIATILVDETKSDRDVRELYTRSRAVRDEIFSQRYRFSNLEHEQERTVMTFGALWRPMLALEAWAGNCFAVRATRDERSCYCVEAGEGPYGAVDDMRLVRSNRKEIDCEWSRRVMERVVAINREI
nr:hypothetical protein [Tanacetum cinerariifolium]